MRALAILLLILVECACTTSIAAKSRDALRLSELISRIETNYFDKAEISKTPRSGQDFLLAKTEVRENPMKLIHAYWFEQKPCVPWEKAVQAFEKSGYERVPLGLPTEHGMPEDAPSFTKVSKNGSLRVNLFFKRDSSALLCLSSIHAASS